MTGLWRHEARLFLRQRLAIPALVLLALLAVASVVAGMAEIARQKETIARIQPQQAADVAAIARWVSVEGDAGNAAYYTFHATWDAPSALAFAAIGQRDVAPYILRVRALGLEAQLYESENYNAELALPGRFDWAFVLTYLAPLFVIILLHDLKSGEREAGRIGLLAVMARHEAALWRRRVALRLGMLVAALLLPFIVGALLSGAGIGAILLFAATATAYLLFWALLCLLVGCKGWSSVTNAAALAASWLVLTLILPALVHLAITAAIPVRQGVELTLAQREKIHGGWDRPKDETMRAFFKVHPEWRDTPPVGSGFHWNGTSLSSISATSPPRLKRRPIAPGLSKGTAGQRARASSCRQWECKALCTAWPLPTCRRGWPIRIEFAPTMMRSANSIIPMSSTKHRSARPIFPKRPYGSGRSRPHAMSAMVGTACLAEFCVDFEVLTAAIRFPLGPFRMIDHRETAAAAGALFL